MRSNTDWFKDAGWGVFTHYLTSHETSAEDWNRLVDGFDIDGLVAQLASTKTKYYFLTIGQNSGHYCGPNEAYDSYVGVQPSKCSRRDLVGDLADALSGQGIDLLVYLPCGAPCQDPIAMEKLEWEWGYRGGWPSWSTERTGKRLAEFQVRWEAVVREWAERWGPKIRGWWFDGCYFADEMYRHPDPPNFESLAAAAKAGNPDCIVAFNPGVKVPIISITEHEDYTAGEISTSLPECTGRWIDGAQLQILSYLGSNWCKGGQPRFPDEFVVGYTKHVNSMDGVITWDVPITKGGLIPQPFVEQLSALGDHCTR